MFILIMLKLKKCPVFFFPKCTHAKQINAESKSSLSHVCSPVQSYCHSHGTSAACLHKIHNNFTYIPKCISPLYTHKPAFFVAIKLESYSFAVCLNFMLFGIKHHLGDQCYIIFAQHMN